MLRFVTPFPSLQNYMFKYLWPACIYYDCIVHWREFVLMYLVKDRMDELLELIALSVVSLMASSNKYFSDF